MFAGANWFNWLIGRYLTGSGANETVDRPAVSATTDTMVGRFPMVTPENTAELMETSTPVMSSNQLSVRSLDLLKSKLGQNRTEHRTDRYESKNLIIRRGQSFQMWLQLSRAFNQDSDKLHLQLKLGHKPKVSAGTLVTVPLVNKLENKRWEAIIIEQKDTRIKLSVSSPPTAPIGRYELSVKTWTPKGSATFQRKPENDIYLLFNPWCKDDDVYMDKEKEREEYVLNDVGKLYYGNNFQIGTRTWNFGQFADGVLEACLFVLEKSVASTSGWGNPVNIVRVVSAMVNSNDDNGVVEGNWSNSYTGGNSPTAWTGSVEILNQYYKSRGKPVKYGQCWVFAGVTNTVLRCLGIPTRSITNFSSAHDTDVSLTTDVYFDEKMNSIERLNSDSIWNFHVWNESWMARPDLTGGMGGWQVVDATPQETSQGTFCCGPTPVSAVRDGLVYIKYDAPFVFAEVNSDRIFWQRNPDGTFTQANIEKNVVGHSISTKAVGSDKREDITHLYKHPEGSDAERIAVETACSYGSKPNTYSPALTKDVKIQISMKGEGPWVGEDASLAFTVKNDSSEKRSIVLYCQVAVMFYTGVLKGTVKKDETIDWTVSYDEYEDQLVDQAALMLTMLGRVSETKQLLANRFNFRLRTPDLTITPEGVALVGKQMSAKITFKNPLSRVLKNVRFRVEGLGLLSVKDIRHGDVGSLETVTQTVTFTPSSSGLRKLLASLDCPQLTQVHGFADILVKEQMCSNYSRAVYCRTGRFPVNSRYLCERPCYKPRPCGVEVDHHDHCDLTVRCVDLIPCRKGENRVEHHTNRFDSNELIVRRGQSFKIWIEFSRPFNPSCDKLKLQIKHNVCHQPKIREIIVPLCCEFRGNQWEAKIVEKSCNRIKVAIASPANAAIGRYELSVFAGEHNFCRKPEHDFYLLFNPWCKNDTVFLEDECERKEYVLNDVGRLYYGTEYQIGCRNWNFGQFAEGILAACLFILEKSQAPVLGWGDPVAICRVMSAMVNSPDDQGVLQGNWSEVNMCGTCPTVWSGSVEILRQYHKSRGVPVKYGQCLVFSGVTTTILRCLGIPTRSVTNFNSAHDTDCSMTTDVFFDEHLKPIDNLNQDSIWNFHLWNESWMARPDLPCGMGGWQVVDATPQETSQGIFRCGPAPVAAIRDGLVYMKYDAPFIFAEVNSDRIFWQRQANGCFAPIHVEKCIVGRKISTKAVGCDQREDITHLYKHPEGTREERQAVENAVRYGTRPNVQCCNPCNDITVSIGLKGKEPQIGEDAHLSIIVKNCCSEWRSTILNLHLASVYYTGVIKTTVKKDEVSVKLKAMEVHTVDWCLPYDLYREHLVDHASMMLTLAGQVCETKQVLATRFSFRLRNPDICISPCGEAVVGRETTAKITFKNPLRCVLKNAAFRVEGLGLHPHKVITHGDIDCMGTVTQTVKYTPTHCGSRKLLACLECPQLNHVHGCADIIVKDNMPREVSINRVGRFPNASAPVVDTGKADQAAEKNVEKKNGLSWLWRINPCCCHSAVDNSDDLVLSARDPAEDEPEAPSELGPNPMVSKDTLVIVSLVDDFQDNRWEARIIERQQTKVKLLVNSMPTAPIGQYTLTVATQSPYGNSISEYDPENDIIVLFNPWCEEDAVYMEDENERIEYVLNDMGIIYYGTESQIGDRIWNFGQFSEGILEACLFVLENSQTPASGWGDPVNVSRVVSAMVNSNDEYGILEGNWSGKYSDGNAPTDWIGSVDILREYHDSGGVPVKYGQCWVFSGVATTVLRCLGLPSRSVTNFNSAHDTDVSLTNDVYVDEEMEPISELTSDSVWNFHVWNECWMARDDLPDGMGGWQVVDATPQETSQGLYCCGPTSVAAIRDGMVHLRYDGPFVFAEVFCEKNAIGHCISTKAVGSDEREDITQNYKHPEDSIQERNAVETATRYGSKPNIYPPPEATDVTLEVTMEGEGPRMGEDVLLLLNLTNNSSEKRNVFLHSQMSVMYYTGVQKAIVKKDDIELEVNPEVVETVECVLTYEMYQNKLVDQAALMLTLSGRVRETEQVLVTQFNFRLRSPNIIITPKGRAVVGKKMAVTLTFKNPLPQILKRVKFRIEGLGMQNKEIPYGDVASRATISVTEKFVPTLAGERKLLASLVCHELTQVYGAADILVMEN
ncbi:Protein-glutamine gamma-glutamyltransferase K [Bagarius yarrelli]|uniref:Protein-glutamine gamma-glutamyltransferase K n=1 Tax=Bagarius yarrelli TaxID=175774 RepID=A0A556U050_BAGYA|nr:Protein-glutamine gamma-glutamyltransferase K [Bagarius yarrelli]